MCIVIDINTIPCVFSDGSDCHDEFEPVERWILKGKGKIIIGGKKYKDELRKMPDYLTFFKDLEKRGKVVPLEDNEVDSYEEEIKLIVSDSRFDDPHILAIIAISKCKVLCSNDKKSFDYIQNQALYPKGVKIPRIYSKRKCENLLVDENIVGKCRESL
jgi:hypothetical protein